MASTKSITLNEAQIIKICSQAVVNKGKKPRDAGRLVFDRATSLVTYEVEVEVEEKVVRKKDAKKIVPTKKSPLKKKKSPLKKPPLKKPPLKKPRKKL